MREIQRAKCIAKECGYAVREMARVLKQIAVSRFVPDANTLTELERRIREETPEDF